MKTDNNRKPKAVVKAKPAPTKLRTPPARPARSSDVLGTTGIVAAKPVRVPAKWRAQHRVLVALQTRLLEERGHLQRAGAESMEPHSLDQADSATDEFDHTLAMSQLSAEQDALGEVNDALARIQAGTYGVCEATGAKIPAARLEAVPWARFTREVEERLEKKGLSRRAGMAGPSTVRPNGRVSLNPDEAEEEGAGEPANDEALSEAPATAPKKASVATKPAVAEKAAKGKRRSRA